MSKNTDVLALKYRPQKLNDVIGQDAAVQTLINAFTSKRMYQTLVFAGNYGCGKTSCARIVAAMDNCEEGPSLEPCGKCKNCKDIFEGRSLDVKEMNAANSRGIDDIRNIADFVSIRPLVSRVKYVILDECHRLTADAAESALKLFEEPPKDVRYVLCTTDLHKMKVTLQSRAMSFRFVKVPWPLMTEHLKSIATKENYVFDESALKIAAKLAEGSVRNALRNLQMLHTFAGERKITLDLAQQALGSIDDNQFFSFIDAVISKEAATSMKIVNAILAKGIEFEQIFNGLLEHLRTLMVVMTCHNTATLLYLSEEEKKGFIHQVGMIDKKLSITSADDKHRSAMFISTMISLLCNVARGVNLNVNPQTLIEQFAIESIMAFGKIEREVKTLST